MESCKEFGFFSGFFFLSYILLVKNFLTLLQLSFWSKKQSRFVGRVIFANFIDIPLERYKSIIKEVEDSLLFKEFLQSSGSCENTNSNKAVKRLSNTLEYSSRSGATSDVIARITKNTRDFNIRYTFEGFNHVYLIDGFPDSSLTYKLRRISSRNQLTHTIIKGILEHQKKFFFTSNPIDLRPFTQVQLAAWINKRQTSWQFAVGSLQTGNCKLPTEICNSWISRVVNSHSIILPSDEVVKKLKFFFPTQKDCNKRIMKQILDNENDPAFTRKRGALTDVEIMDILKKEYGISLSKCSVVNYRKDLGIPAARKRLSGCKYPPVSVDFSVAYPFTIDSVNNNALTCPGIYEISLKRDNIEYPNGKAPVIYIGRTKNIKKRLNEHLRVNNKKSYLQRFFNKFDCSFRYAPFSESYFYKNGKLREEERKLYELFVVAYGASPECNRVKP